MNSKKTFFSASLIAFFAMSTTPTNAIDINGVDFPNEAKLEDCGLVLNGTATRTVWGFKVYVVGLFLNQQCQDCDTIMTPDRMPKRVQVSMLREVSEDKFGSTIQENINQNFSSKEKEIFAKEMAAFLACFNGGSNLDEGSVVTIDYLPEKGMVVGVNERKFTPIPGDDFYHAMLRLWIGTPLQESIKDGLLGKSS